MIVSRLVWSFLPAYGVNRVSDVERDGPSFHLIVALYLPTSGLQMRWCLWEGPSLIRFAFYLGPYATLRSLSRCAAYEMRKRMRRDRRNPRWLTCLWLTHHLMFHLVMSLYLRLSLATRFVPHGDDGIERQDEGKESRDVERAWPSPCLTPRRSVSYLIMVTLHLISLM